MKPGFEYRSIYIKKSDDYRINRVRALHAPVGTDDRAASPIRLSIISLLNDRLDGSTDVYDALNHRIKYEYNKQHRLTGIWKYTGKSNYALYSSERFVWGKKGSADEGNLVGKYLMDAKGKIDHYRSYKYDKRGNVLCYKLYGNLTEKLQQILPLIMIRSRKMGSM